MKEKLFVILGNQLFHPKELKKLGCEEVFMAEDYGSVSYTHLTLPTNREV